MITVDRRLSLSEITPNITHNNTKLDQNNAEVHETKRFNHFVRNRIPSYRSRDSHHRAKSASTFRRVSSSCDLETSNSESVIQRFNRARWLRIDSSYARHIHALPGEILHVRAICRRRLLAPCCGGFGFGAPPMMRKLPGPNSSSTRRRSSGSIATALFAQSNITLPPSARSSRNRRGLLPG